MLAEIMQGESLGKVSLDQDRGWLGENRLPAMCGIGDPCRPVDVESDVIGPSQRRDPGVESHPSPYSAALRPVVCSQGILGPATCQNGVECGPEHGEERIALGLDHGAVIGLDGRSHQLVVGFEKPDPSRPERLDETSRSFDVGEEEGDSAGR